MALLDSATRLISRILSIAHTRIALAGVEIEEEMLRFAKYFIQALAIFFCAMLAILLAILFNFSPMLGSAQNRCGAWPVRFL